MAEIKVDCTGETCPVPLVETRKALRQAKEGDVVEVTGTHPSSKKEIPLAVKALGLELLEDICGGQGGIFKLALCVLPLNMKLGFWPLLNICRHVVEIGKLNTINRYYLRTYRDARFSGRAARRNHADFSRAFFLHRQAGSPINDKKQEYRGDEIHKWPGDYHYKSLPERSGHEIARLRNVVLLYFVFTEHLDIASQRHDPDTVLSLADFFADQLWRKAERKPFDADARPFGRDEMAQFMNEHQEPQNEYES